MRSEAEIRAEVERLRATLGGCVEVDCLEAARVMGLPLGALEELCCWERVRALEWAAEEGITKTARTTGTAGTEEGEGEGTEEGEDEVDEVDTRDNRETGENRGNRGGKGPYMAMGIVWEMLEGPVPAERMAGDHFRNLERVGKVERVGDEVRLTANGEIWARTLRRLMGGR